MSRIALALVLALSACAPDPAELTTSPEDLPAVLALALEDWRAATDGACSPSVSAVVAADPAGMAAAAWVSAPAPGQTILGVWDPNDGRVYVAAELSGDLLVEVMRHELGHACGCPDVTEEGRVMTSPMSSAWAPITAADVACARGAR